MNPFQQLWHARRRRATALLAADALDGAEREWARAHLDGCEPCRTEFAQIRGLLDLLERDETRRAQPPVPLDTFVRRVEVQLRASSIQPGRAPGLRWAPVGAFAVVAFVLIAQQFWQSKSIYSTVATTDILMPDDSLRRIERSLAREQTARYLSDAQDVLVTVASTLPHCRRRHGQVSVGTEAQRSRELLARRAALVDLEAEHLAPAEAVLMDVERALRDVAELRDCVSLADVARVQRQLDEQRLLMRIALVERELQG